MTTKENEISESTQTDNAEKSNSVFTAANAITCFGLFCGSVLLFFVHTFSVTFYVLYSVCATTDFLDGFVARKTHTTTLLGSKLDTARDVLLVATMVKTFLVEKLLRAVWIELFIAMMLLQIISAIIVKVRLGKFYFVHSFAAKVLGACLFLLPFFHLFGILNIGLTLVLALSLWAGVTAILIASKCKTADADIMFVKQVL